MEDKRTKRKTKGLALFPTVKCANTMKEHVVKGKSSAGSNPYEILITTRSSCPPKKASLDQLTIVYVLYKLSKTNSVLRLYGLVMTANFISPDIVSERMYRCSFIFTPL